jgi:hypothetical protein
MTTTQQSVAPDRLQLRSFLDTLSPAGELGRSAAPTFIVIVTIKVWTQL